jgi:hypothetical protein
MGVSIPDEFRGEMAMVGEWQVTSERIIDPNESQEKKPEAIGFGVRKRVVPEDEEESMTMESKKRKWGSTYRAQPEGDYDKELDALLDRSIAGGKLASVDPDVKQESAEFFGEQNGPFPKSEIHFDSDQILSIKEEPLEGQMKLSDTSLASADVDIKDETDSAAGTVIFKKRKPKHIRQK